MGELPSRNNNSDDFENPFKNNPSAQRVSEFMRQHRLGRKAINFSFKAIVYAALVLTPQGWELLREADIRTFLFSRDLQTGLLEDSILNHELYFPNVDKTSLDYRAAIAGRYVAHDFHRPEEFGSKAEQTATGRLLAFMLEEVNGKSPDEYTPTSTVNFFDFCHVLHLEAVTPNNLLENGFVREATYQEAFTKVGIYDRYKTFLALEGATDKTVFAVTPKGNGLIGVAADSGPRVEKPKKMGVLKPRFSF